MRPSDTRTISKEKGNHMIWNQAGATRRTGSLAFMRSSSLYLLLGTGLVLCMEQVYAQPAQPEKKQDQADKPQDRPARQPNAPPPAKKPNPTPGAKPDQGKTRPGQPPQAAPTRPQPKRTDRNQGDQGRRPPQQPPQRTPAPPPARGGNPGDRARSYPPRVPTQQQWRDWERQR